MKTGDQQRTRTLWLVGVLHGFTHLYQVALLPLYLRIQADLKLNSVEQATLLVTAMGLAYFIPSYPLGALADRLSRKKLLTTGLVINALGFIGLSMAPNYGWALASVVLAGFGGTFYHPAATALIARMFPEAKGRALGLVGIGASAGFFLGPIYCGWRAVVSGSWREPVLEIGVLGLIGACLFAWLAREERPVDLGEGQKSQAHRGGDGSAPQLLGLPGTSRPRPDASLAGLGSSKSEKMFPTPTLWAFFLGASFALSLRDFAGMAMATSASLFLQNAHGFNPKSAGLALSGIYLASAISNPLFGGLSDGGRMRWVSFVLLMSAAFICAFPRVPVAWMVPVLLAFGFFFMASYPITEAALMETVHDSVRGRVFGLFITIGGLVGNLSHWVVGSWVQRLGARAFSPGSYFPLYATLALLVVASLAGLPCLHAIRKREVRGGVTDPSPRPSPLGVEREKTQRMGT